MISSVYLLDAVGQIIIFRDYRTEASSKAVDAFRASVISKKEARTSPPVLFVDDRSFLYVRHADIFVAAATSKNANATLALSFLHSFVFILKSYLGQKFDSAAIRNDFTLVYELLDEVIDNGYPQTMALETLRRMINFGKTDLVASKDAVAVANTLTESITGKNDWRRPDLVYQKNRLWIDVLESVNLLMGSDGHSVLRCDVRGVVMMKTQLSGMPECALGLNDKLSPEGSLPSPNGPNPDATVAVELEDCAFHRCVRLGKFDADRMITFVPPDGEFELMRYRIAENVEVPFRVLPIIEEIGNKRVDYNVQLGSNYDYKTTGNRVAVFLPVPKNVSHSTFVCNIGRIKYEPQHDAVVWRIRRVPGGCEFRAKGWVELAPSTDSSRRWSRPPIKMEFVVPSFTASGLYVRFLRIVPQKMTEEEYKPRKFVRKITKNGSYMIRVPAMGVIPSNT